jgi:hypothetical protein
MMKRETFAVDTIYVPTKRRDTLDAGRVDEIARCLLSDGQTTPILVRADGARFVLIEGLHRLEAARALGERTIVGFRVAARKHERRTERAPRRAAETGDVRPRREARRAAISRC